MRKLEVILAVPLAIVGALLLVDRSENPQREYAAVNEAVFSEGWVPKLLPADATNIKVQGNLDTNEVWVRFNLGSSQYSPEQFGFRRVESSQWPLSPRTPRYNSWWFGSLADFTLGSVRLYVGSCPGPERGRASNGHLLVASGEAYLWCESA